MNLKHQLLTYSCTASLLMTAANPAYAQIDGSQVAGTIDQIEAILQEDPANTAPSANPAQDAAMNPDASAAAGQVQPDGQPGEMPQPTAINNTARPAMPRGMSSVLFTFWEYTALLDAKKARESSGVQRGVTQEELDRALNHDGTPVEKPKPLPEERELVLGGIVFTTADDWTIWLNGERVSPQALPKEIIDLKVQRHYIDVKWMDDYTQRIYPVRLRAHQRFNLDTRIFLPGTL